MCYVEPTDPGLKNNQFLKYFIRICAADDMASKVTPVLLTTCKWSYKLISIVPSTSSICIMVYDADLSITLLFDYSTLPRLYASTTLRFYYSAFPLLCSSTTLFHCSTLPLLYPSLCRIFQQNNMSTQTKADKADEPEGQGRHGSKQKLRPL